MGRAIMAISGSAVGMLPRPFAGLRNIFVAIWQEMTRDIARRLQVQERLTQQVADWLQENLNPRGVGVVVEAEHLCMSLRGVRARGARTTTSALHGLLREDARSRQEFFALSGTRG